MSAAGAATGERPAAPPGRRRRRVLLAAVLAAALGGAGVWAVWFSSWLTVSQVRVVGAHVADPAAVRAAAAVGDGVQLARVDADAVAARVGALAPVAAVEVRRGWPSELVVVVTERTPVAVVPAASGVDVVDAGGVAFRHLAAAPPGLLPVRTTGGDEVLRAALGVLTAMPQRLAGQVAEVRAGTRDDVTLRLRDGAVVRWGGPEDSAFKARVLVALLPGGARTYDVSAPGLPTTAGTASPSGGPTPGATGQASAGAAEQAVPGQGASPTGASGPAEPGPDPAGGR